MNNYLIYFRVVISSLLIAVVLFLLKPTTSFVIQNIIVQGVIFTLTSFIPGYLTHVLSYVDFSWPCGLLAIGIEMFFQNPSPVGIIFSVFYCLMGGRMTLMMILVLFANKFKIKEFKRYAYQRIRWKEQGWTSELIPLMMDISLQCFVNMGLLFIPGVLLACTENISFNFFTIFGMILWIASFLGESLADYQKYKHSLKVKNEKEERKKTFRSGLWAFCRHPNYFCHWSQWNAYCIASIPALLPLARACVSSTCWIAVLTVVFVAGLCGTSWTMYYTFIDFTGVVPAEYYSQQKRPDYKKYMKEVPTFFPGLPVPRFVP